MLFKKLVIPLVVIAIIVTAVVARYAEGKENFERSSKDELVKESKKEGKLVWYTSMPTKAASRIAGAFKKKHPFLEVKTLRAGHNELLGRILAEARMEKHLFDVVTINLPSTLVLKEKGITQPFRSAALMRYDDNFKDPAGHWVGVYHVLITLAYNTKLVKKESIPKTWKDLLDPRWKGRNIAIDNNDYNLYAAMKRAWGSQKSKNYFRALAQQELVWLRGRSKALSLLSTGEFPLAIAFPHLVERDKKKGAHIEWVDKLDLIAVLTVPVSLAARAPHPSASRIFIEFLISKYGQNLILETKRIPARLDVKPFSDRLNLNKLNLYPVPHLKPEEFNKLIKEFIEISGQP